jgi:hypothetical protein
MRKVSTFFYGSFMNPEVLAKADVRASETRMARLDDWELRIAPRATLVPAAGRSVYGVLAQLTHPDLDKLYTKDWFGFGAYLPEAVIVSDSARHRLPALAYISWEPPGDKPTAEYLGKMVSVASELGFPDWYVRHIESFGQGG